MNLLTKQKQTHRHGKQLLVTKGEAGRKDKLVRWGGGRSLGLTNTHYYIYIIDKQQGPTVYQGTILNVL